MNNNIIVSDIFILYDTNGNFEDTKLLKIISFENEKEAKHFIYKNLQKNHEYYFYKNIENFLHQKPYSVIKEKIRGC